MQQKKALFRRRAEYILFSTLIFLSKRLPRRFVGKGRRALAFFLKRGSPRHSRLISSSLAMAFPGETASWRANLKERIYGHFSGMFLELARAFSRRDTRSALERTRVHHVEFLKKALEKGRGAIVVSAHFGNWEWIPLILHDRLEREIHIVARPIDNPLIEKRIREFRETMGSRIIYKQGSLRVILNRLASNEIVCLLIDQNTVPREGVFVDFFGARATAVTTVSQLYLKKRIPVVPVFLHYEGEEIVLDVLPEVDFPAEGGDSADVTELTQRLTSLIEEQVRKFPEQWFWFHDRWKTRPQGEAS